jgi:hypothetical protein
VRTPESRGGRARGAGAGRELFVRERRDRLDREPAQPRLVEADVPAREAELLEVTAHGFRRSSALAQVGERGGTVTLGELLTVRTDEETVMDVLGRFGSERTSERTV